MLRLALIAGMGALVLGAFGATYYAGHRAGSAGVEARVAEEIAAEQTRQQAAITAVLEDAAEAAEAAEAENQANQDKADALAAELAERDRELAAAIAADSTVCQCSTNPVISPGDASKLNDIR